MLSLRDWPARLSITIKHILNIAFMQFPTSKFHFVFIYLFFNKNIIFQNLSRFFNSLFWYVEPNTGDMSLKNFPFKVNVYVPILIQEIPSNNYMYIIPSVISHVKRLIFPSLA